jgi:hypothetical protein
MAVCLSVYVAYSVSDAMAAEGRAFFPRRHHQKSPKLSHPEIKVCKETDASSVRSTGVEVDLGTKDAEDEDQAEEVTTPREFLLELFGQFGGLVRDRPSTTFTPLRRTDGFSGNNRASPI